MRDNSLLISDSAVAADAFAANALAFHKTGLDGVWVQLFITRNTADATATLDITFYGKDADSGWALTDDPVAILDQVADGDVVNGASIVKRVKITTKHAYVKPYYNVAGVTPNYDIVSAVESGVQRDALV